MCGRSISDANSHVVIFMAIPCVNDIKPFIVKLMHLALTQGTAHTGHIVQPNTDKACTAIYVSA